MEASYLKAHPLEGRYPDWTPNFHSDRSQYSNLCAGDPKAPRVPFFIPDGSLHLLCPVHALLDNMRAINEVKENHLFYDFRSIKVLRPRSLASLLHWITEDADPAVLATMLARMKKNVADLATYINLSCHMLPGQPF